MTRQAAAKSILSELELTSSQKDKGVDAITHRRSKLLAKLDEQILAAEAMLEGKEYFGEKRVKKTNEDGDEVAVIVPKRISRWFYSPDGNGWFLEVKYGNRALQFAQGKNAIVVGGKENLLKVIDQVKQALSAGELDKAIDAVVSRKKTAAVAS